MGTICSTSSDSTSWRAALCIIWQKPLVRTESETNF